MGLEYFKREVGVSGGILTITGNIRTAHDTTGTVSTGTALAWGRSHALTGTTSTDNFTIADPVFAGREMSLVCVLASTIGGVTGRCTATLGATVSYHSSANSTALNVLTFDAGNESVTLRSLSSTKVFVLTNTNGVALS
jgi:hypothetical protein